MISFIKYIGIYHGPDLIQPTYADLESKRSSWMQFFPFASSQIPDHSSQLKSHHNPIHSHDVKSGSNSSRVSKKSIFPIR